MSKMIIYFPLRNTMEVVDRIAPKYNLVKVKGRFNFTKPNVFSDATLDRAALGYDRCDATFEFMRRPSCSDDSKFDDIGTSEAKSFLTDLCNELGVLIKLRSGHNQYEAWPTTCGVHFTTKPYYDWD